MKITIKMETGNEAFNTEEHVAEALEKVGEMFKTRWLKIGKKEAIKILDGNGNTVGTLTITK